MFAMIVITFVMQQAVIGGVNIDTCNMLNNGKFGPHCNTIYIPMNFENVHGYLVKADINNKVAHIQDSLYSKGD